mmetsp:Transcript_106739/g.185541  ORF Transcript_106739/g.185541 Transcript_106739/m.185541 type:complete len:82 (+) Transcript_106739:145-390(+)
MLPMRRRVLRIFKQFCYAARSQPDPVFGRREIWKVKAWLRESPDHWEARGCAFLRWQQKELEAIIKLAKYRAMKRRYYEPE